MMIKNVSKTNDLKLLFNQEFNFISDLLDNVNLPSEKTDDSGIIIFYVLSILQIECWNYFHLQLLVHSSLGSNIQMVFCD